MPIAPRKDKKNQVGIDKATGKRVRPPKHWGGTPDVEQVDPTPVEMPAGATIPPSLSEQIARAVHFEIDRRDNEGFETPDEADDFEEEDPDALDFSPYEEIFEPMIPEPGDMDTPEPDPEPDPPPTPDEPEPVSGGS